MFMVFLFTLPFVIAAGITQALTPWYAVGCTGTISHWSELLLLVALLCLVCAVGMYYGFKARRVPDPFGILREARTILLLGGTLGSIGMLLVIVDPGRLFQTLDVPWSIFITPAPVAVHLTSTLWQLILARREVREQKTMRASSADPGSEVGSSAQRTATVSVRATRGLNMLANVLADEELHTLLEEFTAAEFSAENLVFVRTVQAWKGRFYDVKEDFREAKARRIFEQMVRRDAPSPVNIPHTVFLKLSEAMTSGKPIEMEVFDEALSEVRGLLHSRHASAILPLCSVSCMGRQGQGQGWGNRAGNGVAWVELVITHFPCSTC